MGCYHKWRRVSTPLTAWYCACSTYEDRYLAPVPGESPRLPGEKYYLDEWDRALMARGVVPPQRELYRERPDYEDCLGAFEWPIAEEHHPDIVVGDRTVAWLDRMPKLDRPLFLTVGFPGPIHRSIRSSAGSNGILTGSSPNRSARKRSSMNRRPFKELREHHEVVDHDSVVHHVQPPAPTPTGLLRERLHDRRTGWPHARRTRTKRVRRYDRLLHLGSRRGDEDYGHSQS